MKEYISQNKKAILVPAKTTNLPIHNEPGMRKNER